MSSQANRITNEVLIQCRNLCCFFFARGKKSYRFESFGLVLLYLVFFCLLHFVSKRRRENSMEIREKSPRKHFLSLIIVSFEKILVLFCNDFFPTFADHHFHNGGQKATRFGIVRYSCIVGWCTSWQNCNGQSIIDWQVFRGKKTLLISFKYLKMPLNALKMP